MTHVKQLSTTHPFGTRKSIGSAKDRQRAQREQLTRLLKESPGKRDARNFLKQFDAPKRQKVVLKPKIYETVSEPDHKEWGSMRIGVNLGDLYRPTVFTRDPIPEEKYSEEEQNEPLHLALVKLREPQTLRDSILGGIALTLSQMAQLGLSTVVVLDCDQNPADGSRQNELAFETTVREQAARLKAALEEYNEPGALVVEHALSVSDSSDTMPSTVKVRGSVQVQNGNLIYAPINAGMILIVQPFAYDADLKKANVHADEVVLALIREFSGIAGQAGISSFQAADGSLHETRSDNASTPALDRIIILDPLGGIPSRSRADGAHVFVNLQAEYHDIKDELQRLSSAAPTADSAASSFSLGSGNPFSRFVEAEVAPLPGPETQKLEGSAMNRHVKNLEVVERALKLLPPSSSGLILTPSEAAMKPIPDDAQSMPSKNPLLHNLLTDKPMTSSSLPTTPTSRLLGSAAPNPATFFKRGIPLTMIPDPRNGEHWQPPSSSGPSIDLANDPRINLSKLVDLINDSFRRTLDPKAYLDRIRGRVAGIIIAGDYEGGAICTWETPSALLNGFPANEAPPDSPYWIPYLDKFAVLTSSQGSGGVSDIVWAALTRTCFPEGIVWRSRTSNPVNKWYQERATGMWNLPGDEWTMFWTTAGFDQRWTAEMKRKSSVDALLEHDAMTTWDAYVDVCRKVQPTWAPAPRKAR